MFNCTDVPRNGIEFAGHMPGSARRLDPAEGLLHGLKGQNLRACTCAVGPVDNLHVAQKRLRESKCSVRTETAITDWHFLPWG